MKSTNPQIKTVQQILNKANVKKTHDKKNLKRNQRKKTCYIQKTKGKNDNRFTDTQQGINEDHKKILTAFI